VAVFPGFDCDIIAMVRFRVRCFRINAPNPDAYFTLALRYTIRTTRRRKP
jgi:hypothetical protein